MTLVPLILQGKLEFGNLEQIQALRRFEAQLNCPVCEHQVDLDLFCTQCLMSDSRYAWTVVYS